MKQTAVKTVVAKILTSDLTQSKLDAITQEYEAFQRYIRGDEDADLYSATKQCADAYVDTESLHDDHDYPWFIRNDVFDVGFDVEQHDTAHTDWWLKLPVSKVWGGINVPIQPHDEIPDEADVKDSKIVREDEDYYAHLTVRQVVEVSEEYDGVIGVDCGVRWVATSVALPSRHTEFYGTEIRRIRRHHHELRTRLQAKGAYETLQSVKTKEYRQVNDHLHKISRAIVEEAKGRNALIVVGNLAGIQNQDLGAEMNRRLHSMPHQTLKHYIEYKAAFAGIAVRSVNEYMTSQTCWRCGEQESTTRRGQGRHLCHACGLDDNADKNGATNIAKRGLGKDIARPLSSLGAVCEPALEPTPPQEGGPPIWIGSWGSKAGLRRVARLGDGWLASGYNTTPEMFEDGKKRRCGELSEAGKDPDRFPNAIATMFFHVTEDEAEATRTIHDRLAPTLGRPAAELAERLLIGSAQTCADKLAVYQTAGVQRVYLWPVENELEQLRLFREQIVPVGNAQAR